MVSIQVNGFLKPKCCNLTATLREKALKEEITFADFCEVLGTSTCFLGELIG